jgi:hypothetical protein
MIARQLTPRAALADPSVAMTEAPRLTAAKKSEQAARDERRARALRENLHRRKEQARARTSNEVAPSDRRQADSREAGEALGLSGAEVSPKSNRNDQGRTAPSPSLDGKGFSEAK